MRKCDDCGDACALGEKQCTYCLMLYRRHDASVLERTGLTPEMIRQQTRDLERKGRLRPTPTLPMTIIRMFAGRSGRRVIHHSAAE